MFVEGPSVSWDRIQKLPGGAVVDYGLLNNPTSDSIRGMLEKLVVVKLNGGLGTSMGCRGPKSIIPVRNDLTFLDLTVQQIEVRKYFICFCRIQFSIITFLIFAASKQNIWL